MARGRRRPGGVWRAWRMGWPFGALCCMTASRWLVEDAFPSASSTYLSQALGCALGAAFAGGLILLRKAQDSKDGFHAPWRAAMAAGVLLAGPGLAELLAVRLLHSSDATLALALCPVVVAVCVSAGGGTERGDLSRLLWPSLVGVAGLMLLLPEPSLSQGRTWIGLAAMPVLVGLGASSVRGAMQMGGAEIAKRQYLAGFLGLIVAALLLGMVALTHLHAGARFTASLGATGFDACAALLSLLALVRLGALRWSAQFLLIPLLAIVEGIVFLRPALSGRSFLALTLLAVGAGYQLLAMPPDGEEERSQVGSIDVPKV